MNEKIKAIEEEIRKTPYHKATEHHIGRLKAKLSRLRQTELIPREKGGGGAGFAQKKSGDATVVLIGPPSVGKSSLLNKLTNAKARTEDWPFTTLTVIPGMMDFKGAKIQIFDLPGIITGASMGQGRGKEVLSVVRSADLIILMTDVEKQDEISFLERELYNVGARINKRKPDVIIKKLIRGGVRVNTVKGLDFGKETVGEVAKEFRLTNAEVNIREKITLDELIDVFSKDRLYIPGLVVVNKQDLSPEEKDKSWIYISVKEDRGIEDLKKQIFEKLAFLRIYLKKPGKEIDFDEPLIMKKGQKISDVVKEIFPEEKEIDKVLLWGENASFEGQQASLNRELKDMDILSFS